MVEHLREAEVPALRLQRGVAGGVLLGGIEVQIEVLRAEHSKVEALVLDFVATEVIGGLRRDCARNNQQEKACSNEP